MTTASHDIDTEHQAGVNSGTEPERAEERGARRLAQYVSRHAFGLYLLVISIIMMLALIGLYPLSTYQYDVGLPAAVLLFGIAVMAWPIILAVRKKQHTMLRIAIAGGSIITLPLIILGMLALSNENKAYAEQWEVPLIGPVVLPLLAIAFHAAAGFVLAKFKPEGENDVERLSNELPVLREERDRHNGIVADRAADVRAEEEDEPRIAASFEEAEAESLRAAEARDEAAAALASNATGVALKEAQEALNATKERSYRSDAQRDAAFEAANEAVNAASADHQSSDEWEAYNAAMTVASDAANRAAEIAADQEAAARRLRDARAAHAAASRAADLRQIALDEAEVALEEARKADKSGWRDVAALPTALLINAGLLYPIWYGWVLATTLAASSL